MDGGRVAARGFQYQYLRTLEQLVALLDAPGVDCVRVEGPAVDGGTADQVDFDVLDLDGSVRMAAQVKSRTSGGAMSGAVALGILLQMAGSAPDAEGYVLLTNGRPGPKSAQLDETLARIDEPAVLRDALLELFHDAPQRRAQLQALDDAGLARLTRCRVEYDTRDDAEIREHLRDALTGIRNRTQQGLGEKSAGLLTGYLISEILDRAADVTGRRACFSVADLRALLLTDGETLARSVGIRDWGTVVGPVPAIPDVARPALVNPLIAAFRAPPGRTTRCVTLVGPSGIGKSSAAALYIAARADAYDLIAWVDCETPYSTRATLQSVVFALSADSAARRPDIPEEELRQAVQYALGRLPGRWLLICDNAESVRAIDRWIPKVGRGDVIITTLNAATHLGNGTIVQAPVMQRSESVELLRRRLRLSEDEQRHWAQALNRLSEELGDWPLALELASGYLNGCSLGLDQLDHYLQALKIRSIEDDDSIPVGYPQTLSAALNLCIDRLRERARPEIVFDLPTVALHMLFAAAHLASHQIPAHLLLAAAISSIDEVEQDNPDFHGVLLVPPEYVILGEALRELHRFSLIRNDTPLLPSHGQSLPGAERTLSVNTVTQALIRERLNGHPARAGIVHRLVGHAQRWLSSPMQLGDLERVQVMQSHANNLLAQIEAIGFASERTALMYGDLAGAHHLQGDNLRAEDLLLGELRQLAVCNPEETVLTAQTRFALALIYIQSHDNDSAPPSALTTTLDDAVKHLEHVLYQAWQWVSEYPKAALKLALDARILLQGAHFPPPASERLLRLAEAFADLESRIAPTDYSLARGTLERAEQHLQRQEYEQAERCCRDILSRGPSGPADPDARRRLIEALAGQEKWHQAIDEVRYWKENPAAPRLYRQAILEVIRNVGYACYQRIIGGDMRTLPLLGELVEWPDLDTFLAAGTNEDRTAIGGLRHLYDGFR